jgi:hypothetical protein
MFSHKLLGTLKLQHYQAFQAVQSGLYPRFERPAKFRGFRLELNGLITCEAEQSVSFPLTDC